MILLAFIQQQATAVRITLFISRHPPWVRAFLKSCVKYVPNRSEVHCVNCLSERK